MAQIAKKAPTRIVRALNEAAEEAFKQAKFSCNELQALLLAKDDPEMTDEALEVLQQWADKALCSEQHKQHRSAVINKLLTTLANEGWTQNLIVLALQEFAQKSGLEIDQERLDVLSSSSNEPLPEYQGPLPGNPF